MGHCHQCESTHGAGCAIERLDLPRRVPPPSNFRSGWPSLPLSARQSITVESSPPETTILSPCANATHVTQLLCPDIVATHTELARYPCRPGPPVPAQILTVQSCPPDTTRPSPSVATQVTISRCPLSVCASLHVPPGIMTDLEKNAHARFISSNRRRKALLSRQCRC